jgi:hypothetical protein
LKQSNLYQTLIKIIREREKKEEKKRNNLFVKQLLVERNDKRI